MAPISNVENKNIKSAGLASFTKFRRKFVKHLHDTKVSNIIWFQKMKEDRFYFPFFAHRLLVSSNKCFPCFVLVVFFLFSIFVSSLPFVHDSFCKIFSEDTLLDNPTVFQYLLVCKYFFECVSFMFIMVKNLVGGTEF